MGRDSEDGVLVWNGLVARVPARVVRPCSLDELAAAIRHALDYGLTVRIAVGGRPVTDAGRERTLLIDVSALGDLSP